MKKSGLIVVKRQLAVPELCVGVLRPKLAGRFRLQTRKAKDLRLVDDTGWFTNLITNQGLNRIGTAGFGPYVHVGAGSAAPSNTDTALQTPLAATNAVQSSSTSAQGTEPYYGKSIRTWRFPAGVAAGTIAELGVGWGVSGTSTLFSRALVLDDEEDPTTITVQSDEVLDVAYELRVYPTLTDAAGTITISGNDHDTNTRAATVTNIYWSGSEIYSSGIAGSLFTTAFSGAIGAVTANPAGTTSPATGTSWSAYSNNSLERAFTSNFSLPQGNIVGGIRSVLVDFAYTLGSYQTEFDPVILKDNTKVLNLSGKVSWGRH